MSASPIIVRLTPEHSGLAKLLPYALERIEASARDYQLECRPEEYARAAISRVMVGDPKVLLLGLIDPDTAMLIGHVLAERFYVGSMPNVLIPQVRADENVGDARFEAVEQAIKWAHQQAVSNVQLYSHRNGNEWIKRLGFQRYRSVLRLSFEGDQLPPAAGPAGDSGDVPGLAGPRRASGDVAA